MADGTRPLSNLEKASLASGIDTDSKLPISSSDSDLQSADPGEEIVGDYGSYRNHVFTDPEVAKYWTDVMHKANYEGRHRFDPDFTWSATEEKIVKRKVITKKHHVFAWLIYAG